MVKSLLKRGASREIKDKYGLTPVQYLDSFKSEIIHYSDYSKT